MQRTRIPYLTHTWNPISGCTKCSPACERCWAERMAKRLAGRVGYLKKGPFRPTFREDRLEEPCTLRACSARIGVGFMGDIGHPTFTYEQRARVFLTMAAAFWHVFVVLTKRPEILREFVERWVDEACCLETGCPISDGKLPPNIWMGTSIWDQPSAERNIPPLLATPAAVRWVSYEPALGRVDFSRMSIDDHQGERTQAWPLHGKRRISWVVCGGESGPGARPMHPEWARTVRDQCKEAGVAYWFKQWGAMAAGNTLDGEVIEQLPGCVHA